jgi:sucrose-6-phosphate hydrolase SacC (GH32 family)
MNDPNGLAHSGSRWHLFYQHHPDSDQWGPMHWGHATSADCLAWEDEPIALAPNDSFDGAFSGCAVVDDENASGFFPEGCGLVVLFTAIREGAADGGRHEEQRLGYWDEAQRRIVVPSGPPAVANPGLADFRDPQVVRLDGIRRWLMVLACGDHLRFYASENLRTWTETGRYSLPGDGSGKILECPNLIRCVSDEGPRWVLAVSRVADASRRSEVVYVVGDLVDGRFRSESAATLPVDYGNDFYAPQVWFERGGERKRWIGWMNNWAYAGRTAGAGWNGILSVPRALGIRRIGREYLLIQNPIPALDLLERAVVASETGSRGSVSFVLDRERAYRISGSANAGETFAVQLSDGAGISYRLEIDSAVGAGRVRRRPPFAAVSAEEEREFRFPPIDSGPLDFTLVLDGPTIESFLAGGRVVVSDLLRRAPEDSSLRLILQCGGPDASRVRCVELEGVMRPGEGR